MSGRRMTHGTCSLIFGSCLNQSWSLAVSNIWLSEPFLASRILVGSSRQYYRFLEYIITKYTYFSCVDCHYIFIGYSGTSTVPSIKPCWPVTVRQNISNFFNPLVCIFFRVHILNVVCGVGVLTQLIFSTVYFHFQLRFCV